MTRHFAPPSRKVEWLPTTRLDLATDTSWVMPVPLWRDVRGYLSGFVEIAIDRAETVGAVDIIIQTAVVLSHDPSAWVTAGKVSIPSSSSVSGAGMVALALGQNVSEGGNYPLLGYARIIVTATDGLATVNLRAALVLKQPCSYEAYDWYAGYVSTHGTLNPSDPTPTPAKPFVLPLDLAAKVSGALHAFAAVQFNHDPAVEASVAPNVGLEVTPVVRRSWWPQFTEAVQPDDDTKVLLLRRGVEHSAPSGLLRFTVANEDDQYSAGFLQTWLLLKQG